MADKCRAYGQQVLPIARSDASGCQIHKSDRKTLVAPRLKTSISKLHRRTPWVGKLASESPCIRMCWNLRVCRLRSNRSKKTHQNPPGGSLHVKMRCCIPWLAGKCASCPRGNLGNAKPLYCNGALVLWGDAMVGHGRTWCASVEFSEMATERAQEKRERERERGPRGTVGMLGLCLCTCMPLSRSMF